MPTVFLDRDGVINENRDNYVKSWQEFHFLPGALDAMRMLTEHGFRIFIVTNQACVNHGLLSQATLHEIHERLCSTAQAYGASITAVGFCPHRPDEACGCRKPRPGMLYTIAQAYSIRLSGAYMVGDAVSDIVAGKAAGCHTVMVRTGRGTAELARALDANCHPDTVVDDLLAAAHWICASREALQQQIAVASNYLHGIYSRQCGGSVVEESSNQC